jgi:Na+/H+-translocating membrane pyrophosphatase
MVGPGVLVIMTPILFGLILGKEAVAGILPGVLVSSV